MSIAWHSEDNELFLNPRLPLETSERYLRAWQAHTQDLRGQIGIATSGSTGEMGRLILLSKSAILASAAAVNQRLQSNHRDVWLKTLPSFHVGGLGILARAHLSGARVVEVSDRRWDPAVFHADLVACNATQVSLVPTQLFDLVQANLAAPKSVRAVVIGGGACADDLLRRAHALGWPALPSYGMTECCSQIATALSPNDSRMVPLPHVLVRIGEGERIEIRSASLLTGQIVFSKEGERFEDPKLDGWFAAEDRGRLLPDGGLEVLGRTTDFVKIGGEGVVISRLETRLEEIKLALGYRFDAAILSVGDERLGSRIDLVTNDSGPETDRLVARFNESVLPFERIRRVHHLNEIPRSPLGKLLRGPALSLVSFEPSADL